jgi:hypothetical protein
VSIELPYATPGYGAAPSAADRIRIAWQRRPESDYHFEFGTALGWIFLSCGFYMFYVLYQLVRRSRDHNLRRIALLEAATTFAWEKAEANGISAELQPNFNRISSELGVLQRQTAEFRDPVVWALISIVASTIVHIIVYIILDGDLFTHDRAEGAIEQELSIIYTRLGAPVPQPDPTRLKAKHNYVGRIVAVIATCGIYAFWWLYDVMVEGNAHFDHNWRWEDTLVGSVQQLGV